MIRQHIIAQVDIVSSINQPGHGSPKIWVHRVSLSIEDKNISFWTTKFGAAYINSPDEPVIVGTYIVDNITYASASSIENLRLQEEAFYFDNENQLLYVHYKGNDPPWIFEDIRAGEGLLISDSAKEFNGMPLITVISGFKTEPRLLSGIKDTQKADDLGKGKFYYSGFDFSIDNSDGAYDGIRSSIINSGGKLLLAELPEGQIPELSDYQQVRTGVITEVSFPDSQTVDVSVTDPRAVLEQKINSNIITATDYPSAASSVVGKRKPILIGQPPSIKPVKVASTVFLIHDTAYGNLQSVSTVYVDGVSTSFTADLLAGTVTVSGYSSGTVTVVANGLDIPNVVDQILFFFSEFGGVPGTASNFNLDEVSEIRDKGRTGALYIDSSGEKLSDVIQDLSLGINTRVYLQNGGIYGFRDLEIKTRVDVIKPTELLEFPEREYDDDKYFSEISVNYNEDYGEGEFDTLTDNSLEDEAFENQRTAVTADFDSTVSEETQAQELVTQRYEQAIEAPATIKITQATPLRFELLDYVNYEHARFYDPLFLDKRIIVENSKYRVESISKINREATLVRVAVADQDEEEIFIYAFDLTTDKGIFDATTLGGDDIMISRSPYG